MSNINIEQKFEEHLKELLDIADKNIQKEYNKKYYQKNKEKIKSKQRQYYQNKKSNKPPVINENRSLDKIDIEINELMIIADKNSKKEYNKKYYEKNKEKIRSKQKEYYQRKSNQNQQ